MFTPNATEKQVRAVELVPPKNAGAVWQGVKHSDALDAFLDKLRKAGWKPDLVRLGLNDTGTDLVVAARLARPPVDPPKGETFWCGFVTSNGGHLAPRLYVGTLYDLVVPMVWGETVLGKLTTNADLPGMVAAGLGQWEAEAETVAARRKALQDWKLKSDAADVLLMRGGRLKRPYHLTWSYIGKADRLFRHPDHADLKKRTAWSLAAAFGLAARPVAPGRQFPTLLAFARLLEEAREAQEIKA